MLDVTVLTPSAVLFTGRARHVTVPGEQGVFEILPFHRPLVSRLLPGLMVIDDQVISINHGVIKVDHDAITAIIEPDSSSPPPVLH